MKLYLQRNALYIIYDALAESGGDQSACQIIKYYYIRWNSIYNNETSNEICIKCEVVHFIYIQYESNEIIM